MLTRNQRATYKSAGLIASALLLTPILAACDGGGTTSGPGAVSEGEARALDEAAEMLEERRLPEGVLPETGADTAPEETAQESETQ